VLSIFSYPLGIPQLAAGSIVTSRDTLAKPQAAPMQHGHSHRRRMPRPPWSDGIRPYVDKLSWREWFLSRQAGGTFFLFGEWAILITEQEAGWSKM